MSIGVSRLYFPLQGNPVYPLELNNSYFLIKLFDAQAFFPAGFLTQADYLLLSSSVESTFMPGAPTRSLHKLTILKKNVPSHLGVNTNLTDWLPARATDTVRITLDYTVTQGTPIKALVDKMDQLQLAAKVSVIRPDVAVAIKVTQIVGSLLSYFLQEGGQTDVFTLTIDLNLSDLKAGYYAAIGSRTDEVWPATLQIDVNGHLTDRGGHEFSRYSYAVIQVLTLKRRGPEMLRDEAWGELLQTGKDRALDAIVSSEEERSKALQEWRMLLAQVRALARKDRGFLQHEIDEIIADAQLAVEQKLLSKTAPESVGLDTSYPDEWREILGVNTQRELRRIVRDYQDALKLSESLMQQYMILER